MAGETSRVVQDVMEIGETRAQMADKLQRLDQRFEETIGLPLGAPDIVNKVVRTVQKAILITQIGATVLKFVRLCPLVAAGAAIGLVMLLRELGRNSNR